MKILSLSEEANAWILAIDAKAQFIQHPFEVSKLLDWPVIAAFAIKHSVELIVVPELPPAEIRTKYNLENLLFEFKPARVKRMLSAVLNLGRRINKMTETMQLIGSFEADLQKLRNQLGVLRTGGLECGENPKVACLISINPLISAGGWVNDIIELIGGRPAFLKKPSSGDHSLIEYDQQPITWDELSTENPDFIILAPKSTGHLDEEELVAQFRQNSAGKKLKSTTLNQVYFITSPEKMHQASPRLYEAVNCLARLVYKTT